MAMAEAVTRMDEFENKNGMRLFGLRIPKQRSRLQMMIYDGIQAVGGAALAACTWKMNFHSMWPLTFSAMSLEGVIHLCKDTRNFFRELSTVTQDRMLYTLYVKTGTFIYAVNTFAFSREWKNNDKSWIPCLALASFGYHIAVSSMNLLGSTINNMSPATKCGELLFGPALIGGAAYYLLGIQEHDEKWLHCLLLLAAAVTGQQITFVGFFRDEINSGPRWLLFKGIELMFGGCVMYVCGEVLFIYSLKNQFNPLLTLFFTTIFLNGVADINASLETFQRCVVMQAQVFHYISGMISGPVLFLSACVIFKCLDQIIMLPVFLCLGGFGLYIFGKSVIELGDVVAWSVYINLLQKTLGPVLIVYSSLASVYTGYTMGWRCSLVPMPLIPLGIYFTYRGFKKPSRRRRR